MKRTVSIAILAVFVVTFGGGYVSAEQKKAEDKKSKAVTNLEQRIEKLSVEPEGETEKEATVREKAVELLKKELDKRIELESRKGEDPAMREARKAVEKGEKSSKGADEKIRRSRNSIELTGCPLDDSIKVNPSLGTEWGWKKSSMNSSVSLTIVNPLERGLTVDIEGGGLPWLVRGLCPGGKIQLTIASRSWGPRRMDVVIVASATEDEKTVIDEYRSSITRVDEADRRKEKRDTWVLKLR